jgi:peroxiredoxin
MFVVVIMSSCKEEPVKYTINATIKGAGGKYIKYIDMTKTGLKPDSLQLDVMGKFSFVKEVNQPGDYIFFFKNSDYIRVTPLPNEIVSIQANYNNLIESCDIKGSEDSKQVNKIIKYHYKNIQILDTLDDFYMKNQLNPKLDTIIKRLAYISDSVYKSEKEYLEEYIRNNSNSIASYVALSLKQNYDRNLFTIKNDMQYFEMVDTALYNRFDTVDIFQMINSYITYAKENLRKKKDIDKEEKSLIGEKAPLVSLPNVYGDTLYLASLKGKYVLVDFWGSWCRPCRKENPNLRKAYRLYRRKGFEIFQIAIEHSKQDWKNTIREDKLYWKYQVSELNYMDSKIAREYKVKAIPANYLIDKDGVVIAQNLFGDDLLNKLKDIFSVKKQITVSDAE